VLWVGLITLFTVLNVGIYVIMGPLMTTRITCTVVVKVVEKVGKIRMKG